MQDPGSQLRDLRLALRGDAKARIAVPAEDIEAWNNSRDTAVDILSAACARNGYTINREVNNRSELIFSQEVNGLSIFAVCDLGGAKRLSGALPLHFEIKTRNQ